jgi:type I restriction enzyme S subunit
MKFRKETEFQETEIGKIPRDWKVTKLGSISKIVSGYTFPLEMQGKAKGRYPFIKVNDMNSSYKYITNAENYVDEEDLPRLKARPFPEGTIIFPKIGMTMRLNKYRILGREALFDNNIAGIIVDNKNVYNEYVYYYLQGKVNLLSLAGMTTVPSITKTKIEKLSILLPPLNEQVKIAEILSKVDDAIKNIDNAIARLECLKRGLMSELLTGRIRVREENGRLSFYRETELQETEIGKIPRGWHVVKLGELIEMNHGERPEVILQEGDVPIYGGGGLYGFTNTYLVDKPYVLILARVGKGSVGKVYLARGRVWVTDNAIYGYSKDPNGITTIYAYYWLLFDKTWIEKYVRRSAGGYAIITLNSLNNLKLPLPPLNEQKGITKILSTIDKAVDLHYKGKERLERLKRGLMDLLLTGKVRVVDGDVGS